MIPKILHFIWLGNKPKYVDFAINAFKEVNPLFKINFVNEDLYTSKVREIKLLNKFITEYRRFHKLADDNTDEVLKDIFNYEIQFKNSKHFIQYNTNHYDMTICSEVLRTYYINKYGGIYIDCDTFPVKPFDDYILEETFKSYHDDFWSGGEIGYPAIQSYALEETLFKKGIARYIRTFIEKDALPRFNYLNDNFYELRTKFLNCKIKYGDKVLKDYNGKDYYLDHYGCTTIK